MIRRARPGDALAVRRLLKDLGYAVESRSTDETVSHVLKHPEAAVFVAAEGLEVIGYAALSVRPQMRLAGLLASIDELVVTPARRAAGIGTLLLDAAVAHARNLQCRRIEVIQGRVRESYLRRFYIARSFVEVDSAVLRIDF
ncbi:MAG: GNAT family N-acetyltransferase [Myxococcales bacterium]|nr:GNAT family N-acetyltransferase [Myxococcales bacterium]